MGRSSVSLASEVVIWQTAHLGDLVLATSLARSIHQANPATKINWVVRKGLGSLLSNYPESKVFEDSKDAASAFRLMSSLGHLPTFFLKRSLRTGLISLGFHHSWGFSNWRGVRVKRLARSHQHETEKNFSLLKAFGQMPSASLQAPWLPAPLSSQVTAVDLVVVPSSKWGTKEWAYYPLLVKRLLEKGLTVRLVGDPPATNESKDLYAGCEDRRGHLPLQDLLALIYSAKGFVGNDSGPMHIARAYQKPVFCFFGPTVQEFGYFPFGFGNDHGVVVQELKGLECRPCHIHGPARCPLVHHQCMRGMTVEKILPSLDHWLASF